MTGSSLNAGFASPSKHRIHGILIVLLAFAIAFGAIVANIAFLHFDKEGDDAEVLLTQLQGLAYRLSALEWQAIGKREISSEVARRTQETQEEMGRAILSLEQSDPNVEALRLLRRSYDAYLLAVNEEFRLIKAGDIAQAQIIDDDLVDPAFDAFSQALTSTGAMYSTKVKRLGQLALFGSSLVLLLAMAAIAALVWRTQKAQAAAEEATTRESALARAQQALLESRDHFRKVVEYIPLSMALVGSDGTIEYINRKAIETFGYLPQDIPNMDHWWVQAYPDETYRAEVTALWMGLMREALAQDHEIERRDYRVTCKNGSVKVVAIFGVWIADKVLVVFEDITERKQAEAARLTLEAQLRESQKMEALGTMAGGVAHDFNNALAMIIGNAELARQDVGPGHAALVSLEEIGKACRRATDLVQQILAFSRHQKLERKATSLALVVVESARLIRATLPVGVSLNVECKADTPAVLADATQVQQILLNLCANAVHAVEDQGQPGLIEVSLSACDQTQNVTHGDLPPCRYACLTVGDNGSGMEEETRSRIFEPFFTTKSVGKGTGLGLAVVHGIVQAHEARIEVESTPGGGSTFRIYFPAIDAPVAEVAAPDAVPTHGAGKRVLYIDDEEAIIFLMKRLLERRGFRVSGYTDPREALAAVKANPDQFDLAVTDYKMPGMSGLQVAEALRDIRADLPVVLASGYIT